MAEAIKPTESLSSAHRSAAPDTPAQTVPTGLNESLASPIVADSHWMVVICGSPSLALESRIDALQRKFPTVGRKPFERGGG